MLKLFVFGTGKECEKILGWIDYEHVQIIGYINNSDSKQGEVWNGSPIVLPEDLPSRMGDFDNILIAENDNNSIKEKLIGLGVDEKKIVEFYRFLSPSKLQKCLNVFTGKALTVLLSNHLWNHINHVKNTKPISMRKQVYSMKDITSLVISNDMDTLFRDGLMRNLAAEGIAFTGSDELMKEYDHHFSVEDNIWKQRKRIQTRLADLYENLDKYCHVYYLLADELSRQTFTDNLLYRIYADFSRMHETELGQPEYFNSIFEFREDETYVDCGAYTGDTLIEFIKNCGVSYHHIYAYEPLPNHFEQLVNTCFKTVNLPIEKVTLRECAVSDVEHEVPFRENGGGSHERSDGSLIIKAVSLDNDIRESVTLIKMDIEGGEYNAIMGARRHIRNETPKLAVSLYHLPDDFWKLPLAVLGINKNYNIYVRQHSNTIWDVNMYCVPKK